MTRQQANMEILKELQNVVEQFPDWRFGQILANMGVIEYGAGRVVRDPFYQESTETLKEIRETTSTK